MHRAVRLVEDCRRDRAGLPQGHRGASELSRIYRDRSEAGEILADLVADALAEASGSASAPVVLALPRGGVQVAEPIARRLGAPLTLVLVRKVRTPGFPELAMGAVAQVGGEVAIARHSSVTGDFGVAAEEFDRAVEQEREALTEQARRYRPPGIDIRGRTAVVVDDGLATGMTMQAAVSAVRRAGAARVVLAVPVASTSGLEAVPADIRVCPLVPPGFHAVSTWYRRFDQTSDDEVLSVLSRALGQESPSPGGPPTGGQPDGSPDTGR